MQSYAVYSMTVIQSRTSFLKTVFASLGKVCQRSGKNLVCVWCDLKKMQLEHGEW